MSGNPDPNANPGGGTPPPPPAWHTTITDPELTGYIQTRGLDKLPSLADAFVTTAKAHREASSKLSTPVERLLVMPTDGDAREQKEFWQKLGAPAEPKDYVFAAKFGDDALTEKFSEAMRANAAALNMPKEMATKFVDGVAKFMADRDTQAATDRSMQIAADQRALETAWGQKDSPQFKAQLEIADRGAARVAGEQQWAADDLQRIRDAIGSSPLVAKLFNFVGRALGEAKYMESPNAPNGIMSRDQALELRFTLAGIDKDGHTTGKGDKDWQAKLMKGDAEAKRQWAEIIRIIAGV